MPSPAELLQQRGFFPKPELMQGQTVPLFRKTDRTWERVIVKGKAATPRSYVVQRLAGGVPLHRNRVHLRTTGETFAEGVPPTTDGEEEEEDTGAGAPVPGSGLVLMLKRCRCLLYQRLHYEEVTDSESILTSFSPAEGLSLHCCTEKQGML